MYTYHLDFTLAQPKDQSAVEQRLPTLPTEIAVDQWLSRVNHQIFEHQVITGLTWQLVTATLGTVKITTTAILTTAQGHLLKTAVTSFMFDHQKFTDLLGDVQILNLTREITTAPEAGHPDVNSIKTANNRVVATAVDDTVAPLKPAAAITIEQPQPTMTNAVTSNDWDNLIYSSKVIGFKLLHPKQPVYYLPLSFAGPNARSAVNALATQPFEQIGNLRHPDFYFIAGPRQRGLFVVALRNVGQADQFTELKHALEERLTTVAGQYDETLVDCHDDFHRLGEIF